MPYILDINMQVCSIHNIVKVHTTICTFALAVRLKYTDISQKEFNDLL